jgi:hypothetical protein
MKILLTALSLALLTGTAGAAGRPDSGPVALSTCRFFVYTPDAFNGDRQPTKLRTLWVTFENTGDAPITDITFSAVDHGERLVVTDKGRFSKGALITHQLDGYSTGRLDTSFGPDRCKVTSARFANGVVQQY